MIEVLSHRIGRAWSKLVEAVDTLFSWMRVPEELAHFLSQEERRTHIWMAYARFALVGTFLFFSLLSLGDYDSWDEGIYDIGWTLAFLPAGFVQLFAARFQRPNSWLKYVVITVDVLMLGIIVAVPPPYAFQAGSVEAAEEVIRIFRAQEMQMLYIFYSWVLISQSTRFVAYFGFLLWLAWIIHLIGVLVQPDVFTMDDALPEILQGAPRSVIERHPRYIDPDIAGQNMAVIFVLTMGFIVVIRRMQSLTTRLYRSEQSRSALSRYFSPNIVDRVLTTRRSGLYGRRRETVILFADLVGFTREAETLPPDEVFELLREFHGVVEHEVFAHEGTMEKYIGDAVLATFGGLDGSDDDASRALRCALALQEAMVGLNTRRRARGARPLELAIGLHHGPTVSGVIGEGRNMAFVVTGASVAIANRVQTEARELNADIVLSDAFAARCKSEPDCEGRMAGFTLEPARKLKGLSQPMALWHRARSQSGEC